MRSAFSRVRDGALLATAVAAVLVSAWIFIRYGSFVLGRIPSRDMGAVHVDFDSFWQSTRAMWAGTSIYDTSAQQVNLNPPFLTFLLAPFGLVEALPAYRAWVLLSLVLMVVSMTAVAKELRLSVGWASLVVSAVLVSSPMLGTLGLGQMYPLLVGGLTACWFANRRGRPFLEGALLGLVVALKPSLAPLVLLPAVRRQWWPLAAALLTGWWATVIGWLAAGGSSFPDWVRIALGKQVPSYFDNASLPGTVARLASANEWARPLVELPAATLIGFVLAAAVLALTVWRARRAPAPGVPDTALWALSAASLLASPIAWHNYLVLLAPAVFFVIARGRKALAVLLLALPLIGAEWPGLWYGDDGLAPALPLTLYCAVLLTYWLALLPPASRRPDTGVPTPVGSAPGTAAAGAARRAGPQERAERAQPEPEDAATEHPPDEAGAPVPDRPGRS